MRRRSVFWALVLIGLGVFLLLRDTGRWRDVSVGPLILIALGGWLLAETGRWTRRYGFHGGGLILPLVLIGVGAVLLLRDLDVISRSITLGPVVLIAIGGAVLLAALPFPRPAREGTLHQRTESVPLDRATSARISLSHGAGRLRIVPLSDPTLLLQGTLPEGTERHVHRAGSALEVRYRQRWGRSPRQWWGRGGEWRGLDWTIGLSSSVPISLELRIGASSADLDLDGLQVPDLRADAGASQLDVAFPSRGRTTARLKVGAAQVRLRIPSTAEARIHIRGRLTSTRVDGRFASMSGGLYQSPGFDQAADRVDVEIEAGAAEVSVAPS
jgi:hypothetical protein